MKIFTNSNYLKFVKNGGFLLILLLLSFCLGASGSFAQDKDLVKIADSISAEGKMLHRSEWASWYGTDIFLDKCKNKAGQQGGYISYDTGHGLNNIFFSKGPDPEVLATTSFGYDFNSNNYKLDTVTRKFTPAELELYTIRLTAIKRINSDTTFRTYRNTELNPVPIMANGLKKVYVLTGTNVTGVVIFGNDYLLSFDDDNSVKSVKRLHKNIIPVTFKKTPADSDKTVLASMHTHLPETGDFITATDICTLMLYEHFTTWNQHIVTSKNYVSIWDCHKNTLAIMTFEAWQKMNPLKKSLESSKDH